LLITVQDLTSDLFTPAGIFKTVWSLNYQALYHYNRSPWVEHGYAPAIDGVHLLPKGLPVPEGAWHIELLDTSDQEGALGYHEDEVHVSSKHSTRGLATVTELPLAKVFVKSCAEYAVAPSEVASHELLEMAVDPYVLDESKLRKYLNEQAHWWYIAEVGDPVQGEGYDVGAPENRETGVIVANFAWPLWWGQLQTRSQLDFRGTRKARFELAPGGYMSVAPENNPTEWSQIYGSATAKDET
jgi:hypothetical protein